MFEMAGNPSGEFIIRNVPGSKNILHRFWSQSVYETSHSRSQREFNSQILEREI